MATLKTLAIAVAFIGSTSLALAQGPGIAPNSSVLPPQSNTQGTVASPSGSSQRAVHVKKSHRLYNEVTTSKKKHHTTSK